MELGKARVMVGAKTFDHIINFKDYEGNIAQIENALLDIENVRFSGEAVQVVKEKLYQVKDKLEILRPRSRVKRGIFNGLGSMIKIVSGYMDAYDEEKIGNR